jgi:hypothetical protein
MYLAELNRCNDGLHVLLKQSQCCLLVKRSHSNRFTLWTWRCYGQMREPTDTTLSVTVTSMPKRYKKYKG